MAIATPPSIFDEAEYQRQFPGTYDPTTGKRKGLTFGKASREQKGDYYQQEINKILGAGESEAHRITAEEENRGQKMEDIVRASVAKNTVPELTRESIDLAITGKTDEAARRSNASMSQLRSQLGAAGEIGGGRAAGIAAHIALERSGQVIDARRSTYLDASRQNALIKAQNFQQDLGLGNAANRPVSTLNMDWIQQALGLRLHQQEGLDVRSAGKDAAQAAEKAGKLTAGASLAGAGLGLLGA